MCGPSDLWSWTRCGLTCWFRDRRCDIQERTRADDCVSSLSLNVRLIGEKRSDYDSFAAFGLGAPLGAGTGTLIGGAIASTGE